MAVCVSGDWIESGALPAADAGQHSGEGRIFCSGGHSLFATSRSSRRFVHFVWRCGAGRSFLHRVPQDAFLDKLNLQRRRPASESGPYMTPRHFLVKSAQVIERTRDELHDLAKSDKERAKSGEGGIGKIPETGRGAPTPCFFVSIHSKGVRN